MINFLKGTLALALPVSLVIFMIIKTRNNKRKELKNDDNSKNSLWNQERTQQIDEYYRDMFNPY